MTKIRALSKEINNVSDYFIHLWREKVVINFLVSIMGPLLIFYYCFTQVIDDQSKYIIGIIIIFLMFLIFAFPFVSWKQFYKAKKTYIKFNNDEVVIESDNSIVVPYDRILLNLSRYSNRIEIADKNDLVRGKCIIIGYNRSDLTKIYEMIELKCEQFRRGV